MPPITDGQHDYQYQERQSRAPAGSLMGTDYNAIGQYVAASALQFGDPVFYRDGDTDKVYPPRRNKAVATLSADLVASNSIVANINGVSVAAVVFATSHDATMAALATAIQNAAGVVALNGNVKASASGRTLTVVGDDIDLTCDLAITLGASQPADSWAYSCKDTFAGVVIRATVSYTDSNIDVPATRGMAFLNRGPIMARIPAGQVGVSAKKAYVVVDPASADYKKFTSVAANGLDVGARFASNPTSGLVEVDIAAPLK